MTASDVSVISRVEEYIDQQASLDVLRFITCGSVDDGKSTLIGRMLHEAQLIFEDQVATLKNDSRKMGTQGGEIDYALLVDGLVAEREQGITIDVAYRFFATDHRKFIVADTPGHEQYTRNMVTGASTADVAVILVDATNGVLTQTRRHSFIVSLLGIKHVVLAVNKMDLVDFDQTVFDKTVEDYRVFAENLTFESITAIPLSALKGDNIIERSAGTNWYSGPTLLGFLETVEVGKSELDHPFRFPVQWVNRPNSDFRGYSGTVVASSVKKGQQVRVLPSGEVASVEDIVLFTNHLDQAVADQAVTITLDHEVDISRGDVLVAADNPCEVSDQFEVSLVWMDKEPGYVGRNYWLVSGTSRVNATLSDIKYKYNINTFEQLSSKSLALNDIGEVTLSLDRGIPFESYSDSKGMGSFVLIVNGHPGMVIWFTGLSGAGKSTIANGLEQELHSRAIHTYILDGDNVRHGLNNDLGFTDADRVENVRRIAEVSKLMVDAGVVVMTSFISPFRSERDMARTLLEPGEFVEVHVDVPLEAAEQRDPKGLYKKARRGELPNFTGIDSDYEKPEAPDLHLRTDLQSVDDCVSRIMAYVEDSELWKQDRSSR